MSCCGGKQNKRILIVGPGRAGKDTAGEYLERITGLKFAGTTSKYLAKYVAQRLEVSEEEAYATRHMHREEWFRIGNEVRDGDPTLLIRESLQYGDIVGGIRDIREIEGVRQQCLVDLVLWVDRQVQPDPTLTFGPEWADVVVRNHGPLVAFQRCLWRLADFAGLLKEPAAC